MDVKILINRIRPAPAGLHAVPQAGQLDEKRDIQIPKYFSSCSRIAGSSKRVNERILLN